MGLDGSMKPEGDVHVANIGIKNENETFSYNSSSYSSVKYQNSPHSETEVLVVRSQKVPLPRH